MRSLRHSVVHRKDDSRKKNRTRNKNVFENHSEYPRILTHRNMNRKRQSFFSIYSLKLMTSNEFKKRNLRRKNGFLR